MIAFNTARVRSRVSSYYASRFGPLVVAVIAKVLPDRNYRVQNVLQARSAPQPDYLF